MGFSLPFGVTVSQEGVLLQSTSAIKRTLKEMLGMYREDIGDTSRRDELVYEVYQRDVPSLAGELVVCTTILQPGRVGDEYFMTKGHFHIRRDTGEVYFGLRGSGLVLMETEGQEVAFEALPICPNAIVYVPPLWGHRTVNVGSEPLVFLAVYPADAGHDYGTIEKVGFHRRVIDHEGLALVVPSETVATDGKGA